MTLKNKNPFVNMRLQKVTVGILCLVLVGLASCVKQKNCDCDLKGKFVYFEEPKEIIYCGYNREVNAVLISKGITEFGITDFPHYIVSSVPTKFKSKDTLNVAVCLKAEKRDGCRDAGAGAVYKLKCIEKED